MNRTILILSPHFPPSNAPDMQRVRLLLPYLREQGWEAEVLAVEPGQVAAPVDSWLTDGLPPDVPVHRVAALGLGWGRIPGLGMLIFRALGALRRTGDALVKSGRFNLVYFSTTQFGVHTLGPRWQRRFGVPFVMDYQDPWVNDYYRQHTAAVPPGGRIKYAVADRLNRWAEPRVLRHCAGITSVSGEDPRQLRSGRRARRHAGTRIVQRHGGDDHHQGDEQGRADAERNPQPGVRPPPPARTGRLGPGACPRWVRVAR